MPLDLPVDPPEFVALDTETSGLHPDDGARVACVAIAWPSPTGEIEYRALPFDQGVRDKLSIAQISLDLFGADADPNLTEADWHVLLAWLQEQRLVFHNAKFDLHMMRTGTRHWRGIDLVDQLYWDTMLTSGTLDPLEPRGLDSVADRLGFGGKVGLDGVRGWLKANGHLKGRYDLVPWDIIEQYVTADTVKTAQIHIAQMERLAGEEQVVWDRIEQDLALTRALYAMEMRGIRYDDAASMEAAEVLERQADALEKTMPFKCTGAEGKAYFFGKLKLEADRVSDKTGEPSLDEEQVRKFAGQDVPWAKEYAEVTKKRRAVSMWYRGYPEKIGADGRLRTVFRQGHVKSGRMSVERVQLQAMPKKDKNIEGVPGVRTLILPEDGYGLWNLDLSQAELRVASVYSQCRRMLQQLADGEDIHSNNTRSVLEVDEGHPQWKEKRDIAKRLTFGGIFMIGGETFQATLSKLADIHLPVAECDRLVRGWRNQYPEFEIAYNRAQQKVYREGHVRILPNTRYEELSYFSERDWPRTAWNRIVQGSLARAFGIWLGEIERRWPGYAILTVHDSVVLEAPLDEGQQVAEEIAAYGGEMMTELFNIEMRVDIDRW